MEINEAQYERIAPHLPVQRGSVSVSNLQVLNAILYVAEQAANRGRCPLDSAIGTPSILK